MFQTMGSSRCSFRKGLLLLLAFFVLKNILKNDYRKEEIQYLRDSGLSEEQIERYVPKTAAEREEYSVGLEQMKKDILYLLKEVEMLKEERKSPSKHISDSGKEEALNAKDRMR